MNAKFDFDSKLGRAWVDVENVDSEFMTNRITVNREVNGLSYDSDTKKVLYQVGDRQIVCGEATNFLGFHDRKLLSRGFIRGTHGHDGFHQTTQTIAKVTLRPTGGGSDA